MYVRPFASVIQARLEEPPQRLIVLAGPRQVGKSRLMRTVGGARPLQSWIFHDSDRPEDPLEPIRDINEVTISFQRGRPADSEWMITVWNNALKKSLLWRDLARGTRLEGRAFLLVIDEVQRIPRWSEVLKGLWDELHAAGAHMHVVLLGSSPWLLDHGLSESLMGRFELLRLSHWEYKEMRDSFGYSLEEYIYFGGYPGAAAYIRDEDRWRTFVRASLVDPSIETDVLQLARVEKPALLRQLFEIGSSFSGQIVAMTKVVSQLQDAGNTTTLSDYLQLLARAGILAGLRKYSQKTLIQRGAPPKFQVLNGAFMSICSNYDFAAAQADRSHWGRVVESAVGAHLINTSDAETDIFYWRESPDEVDFVIVRRGSISCVEVKISEAFEKTAGLRKFSEKFGTCRCHVVGAHGTPLAEFLSYPARHWVE